MRALSLRVRPFKLAVASAAALVGVTALGIVLTDSAQPERRPAPMLTAELYEELTGNWSAKYADHPEYFVPAGSSPFPDDPQVVADPRGQGAQKTSPSAIHALLRLLGRALAR